MSEKELDLAQVEGLRQVIETQEAFKGAPLSRFGRLFCPECGDFRSMDVARLWEPENAAEKKSTIERLRRYGGEAPPDLDVSKVPERPFTPSLFLYCCRECSTCFTALVYRSPSGRDLAVLPSVHGGLRTKHTPSGVAFYLDQAARADSIGARSAAVAMYRGALEHLLFEQGFKDGMLGQKLAALEAEIENGTAPKWARELDTEFLKRLKDLGNGAIHPNNGDVSQQSELDAELLGLVKGVFLHLLFLVYEVEHEKKTALGSLRAKASKFKK